MSPLPLAMLIAVSNSKCMEKEVGNVKGNLEEMKEGSSSTLVTLLYF